MSTPHAPRLLSSRHSLSDRPRRARWFRGALSRRGVAAALLLACAAVAWPGAGPAGWGWASAAQVPDGVEPLQIGVAQGVSPDSVTVTLTFSRPAVYRYEETRSRLRLWVEGPVDRSSLTSREIDSDIVRRVRFDEGSRGTTVVFHLGRRFGTFTSDEHRDPFRVVVTFLAEGETADTLPAPGSAQAPPWPGSGAPAGPAPAEASGTPRSSDDAGSPGEGSGAAAPAFPDLPEVSGPMRRVVIDPGHGGREDGAISPGGLKEKDLVLDIARRLRDRLRDAGYAAALTRDDDHAMDLDSRTSVANRLKADLFLSIHANASRRAGAHGAETYFLSYGSGSATDPDAMRLAGEENLSPIGGAGARSPRDEDLELVLWEMAQAGHLASSSRLAGLIQDEMNGLDGAPDRGVKQAPFRVLVGAAMPAALIEVGFLTHAEEERQLASGEHRDRIAAALAAAVERFRQERLAAHDGAP